MIRSALTFLAILVLTANLDSVAAEQPIPNQYQPYVSLLQAQKSLHDAEYQSAAQRLRSLETLKAGGHASWLEVRRQQLNTDNLLVKAKMYDEYLSRAQSVLADSNIELHEDPAWNAGQIHFTDMHIRIGDELRLDPTQSAEMIEELNQDLIKQNEQVAKLVAATQSVGTSTLQHRLNMARGEAAVTQARIEWLQGLKSIPAESRRHTVSRISSTSETGTSDLQSASVAQCKANTSIIEHMLSMEGDRLGKVRELKAMNMASQQDIDLLENKISQLQAMKEGQLTVSLFLESTETQYVSKNRNDESTVAQLRGSFQKCEAEFQLQAATNEKNFLSEVLNRLELAAQRIAANQSYSSTGGLSQTLRIGQQNEIKNYRNQIRLAELKANLAECRLKVIKFQDEQGSASELVVKQTKSTDKLMLALNSLSLTNFLTVADSSEFLLESMVHKKPIGSLPTLFRGFDTNYRPIQLTSSSRNFSSSYRPSSRGVSSSLSRSLGNRSHVWTHQHGRGIRSRNKVSSFSIYGSSLYRNGSRYSRSRLGSTRAYPFGALDSRLRRFQPAGYPPWLLPGSPTNFRSSAFSW